MRLAGIDLAWQGEKNPSAIAIGDLNSRILSLTQIFPACYGIDEIIDKVDSISGIAIDAPLIIKNCSGQRDCEKSVSKTYGARGASCHTSNLSLYPDASSVRFANKLIDNGFCHIETDKWIVECYPHPSLLEIFNLPVRLKYKKGNKSEKLAGQINLANLIKSLSSSPVLQLQIPNECAHFIDESYILSLIGKAIKTNEDALDSIICLYIAALYQSKKSGHLFGDLDTGYVWVPTVICV